MTNLENKTFWEVMKPTIFFLVGSIFVFSIIFIIPLIIARGLNFGIIGTTMTFIFWGFTLYTVIKAMEQKGDD